jgi:hypothetical protein
VLFRSSVTQHDLDAQGACHSWLVEPEKLFRVLISCGTRLLSSDRYGHARMCAMR